MKMNIFTQSLMHIRAFYVVLRMRSVFHTKKKCLYWTYEMVSYNQTKL